MYNKIADDFKKTVKEFSKEHNNMELSTIIPFGPSGKTVAVCGLQEELKPKFFELIKYIETKLPNLVYTGTVSDFQINDEPFMMVMCFEIKS